VGRICATSPVRLVKSAVHASLDAPPVCFCGCQEVLESDTAVGRSGEVCFAVGGTENFSGATSPRVMLAVLPVDNLTTWIL